MDPALGKPTIIVFVGPPGLGKTTLATAFVIAARVAMANEFAAAAGSSRARNIEADAAARAELAVARGLADFADVADNVVLAAEMAGDTNKAAAWAEIAAQRHTRAQNSGDEMARLFRLAGVHAAETKNFELRAACELDSLAAHFREVAGSSADESARARADMYAAEARRFAPHSFASCIQRASPDDFHHLFAAQSRPAHGRAAQWHAFNARVLELFKDGASVVVVDFPYCTPASRAPLRDFRTQLGADVMFVVPDGGAQHPALAVLAAHCSYGRRDRGGPAISLKFGRGFVPPSADEGAVVRYNVFREPIAVHADLEALAAAAAAAEAAGANPLETVPGLAALRWLTAAPRFSPAEIAEKLVLDLSVAAALGIAGRA
jgi:hypothetical protein